MPTRAARRTVGGRPAQVWAALGAIYLIWGSTYLGIRVAIETIPPFLMAGIRFLAAGALLYGFSIRRGDHRNDRPEPRHWWSAFVVGGALLLGGNGGVVWAEQRVPSSIAALVVATTPLWMALFDRLMGRRLQGRALVGLLVGFAGVGFLVAPRSSAGAVDPLGAAALTFAALAWAAGSLYSRRAALPRRPTVAIGMEMLAGGLLLTLAGLVTGEAGDVHLEQVSAASALAFVYLIAFGSLVGFTAYIWLLRSAPISLVSTYAYVNPVVAVFLGWAILAEPITANVLVAAAVIVAGVAMMVSARASAAPQEVEIGSPADAPCPPEPDGVRGTRTPG